MLSVSGTAVESVSTFELMLHSVPRRGSSEASGHCVTGRAKFCLFNCDAHQCCENPSPCVPAGVKPGDADPSEVARNGTVMGV